MTDRDVRLEWAWETIETVVADVGSGEPPRVAHEDADEALRVLENGLRARQREEGDVLSHVMYKATEHEEKAARETSDNHSRRYHAARAEAYTEAASFLRDATPQREGEDPDWTQRECGACGADAHYPCTPICPAEGCDCPTHDGGERGPVAWRWRYYGRIAWQYANKPSEVPGPVWAEEIQPLYSEPPAERGQGDPPERAHWCDGQLRPGVSSICSLHEGTRTRAENYVRLDVVDKEINDGS